MGHGRLLNDHSSAATRWSNSYEGLEINPFAAELELDPFATRSEVEGNHSTLETDPVHYGLQVALPDYPELEPAHLELRQCNLAPQLKIGKEEKEAWGDSNEKSLVKRYQNKRIWIPALLAALVIVVAAAVTISLVTRRIGEHPKEIPRETANLSTCQPINNTGLAILSGSNFSSDASLYFQHYGGQIRELISSDGSSWAGGMSSDAVILSDARDGTPLATVSYMTNNTLKSHLFYVDSSNMLQELIRPSPTESWQVGPLGSSNYKVSKSPRTGLSACWLDDESISVSWRKEIRLFYGSFDNIVHELKWSMGDSSWKFVFAFPNANGSSGLACKCSSLANGPVIYLFSINAFDQIEVWWKDSDTSSAEQGKNSPHPVGLWTKGATTSNHSTLTNSALHFTSDSNLYYQDHSNNIMGRLIETAAENSTFAAPVLVARGAYPGTSIAWTEDIDRSSGSSAGGNYSTGGNNSTGAAGLSDHCYFQTDQTYLSYGDKH